MRIICERVRLGKPTTIILVAEFVDPNPKNLPTLRITEGKKSIDYLCEEFPSGSGFDGRSFHLTKLDRSEAYDVFIHRNGQDHICSCFGHTRFSRCKHVDAFRGLIEGKAIPEVGSDFEEEEFPSQEQVLREYQKTNGALPF